MLKLSGLYGVVMDLNAVTIMCTTEVLKPAEIQILADLVDGRTICTREIN